MSVGAPRTCASCNQTSLDWNRRAERRIFATSPRWSRIERERSTRNSERIRRNLVEQNRVISIADHRWVLDRVRLWRANEAENDPCRIDTDRRFRRTKVHSCPSTNCTGRSRIPRWRSERERYRQFEDFILDDSSEGKDVQCLRTNKDQRDSPLVEHYSTYSWALVAFPRLNWGRTR